MTKQDRDWRLAVAYALFSLVALGGLLIGNHAIAVDLPNHAARLFVECNLADPDLSRMYSVEYGLIPNLAIDILGRPFCGLVDPEVLLRWTMVLTMAGILFFVWKIQEAIHERANVFVLLAPALTFNIVTSMGYLNYLIGTLLFLILVWSTLRFDMRPLQRAALTNILGILLYFCHIFALGIAGVYLFGLLLARSTEPSLVRRVVRAGIEAAVSFAIPLVLVALSSSSGSGFSYPFVGKFRTLVAPLFYLNVYVAHALLFGWFACLYWAVRERKVVIAKQLRIPIMLLAALVILVPTKALNAVDIDARILVSLCFLVIGALASRSADRAVRTAVGALVTATLAVQVVTVALASKTYDRQVAELRSAFEVIPTNATIFPVWRTAPFGNPPQIFYTHLTSYATRDRKAFNPLEFTGAGMQPLVTRPAFASVDVKLWTPEPLYRARLLRETKTAVPLMRKSGKTSSYLWQKRFDYVVFYHFGKPANPFPEDLRPVRSGSFFTIYRTVARERI